MSDGFKKEECRTEPADADDDKVFECYLCALAEKYDYFGSEPKFIHPIQFREDVFVMKDPFSPSGTREATNFIVLGALCSVCSRHVCADQETCSIFYGSRYCRNCAIRGCSRFPVEVQKEVSKMTEPKTTVV